MKNFLLIGIVFCLFLVSISNDLDARNVSPKLEVAGLLGSVDLESPADLSDKVKVFEDPFLADADLEVQKTWSHEAPVLVAAGGAFGLNRFGRFNRFGVDNRFGFNRFGANRFGFNQFGNRSFINNRSFIRGRAFDNRNFRRAVRRQRILNGVNGFLNPFGFNGGFGGCF
jgi:hypothetical protein